MCRDYGTAYKRVMMFFLIEKTINIWYIKKYIVILHPHFEKTVEKQKFNYKN